MGLARNLLLGGGGFMAFYIGLWKALSKLTLAVGWRALVQEMEVGILYGMDNAEPKGIYFLMDGHMEFRDWDIHD